MASEILGLFTTPDQYNLMQQQATDARALQYAQLNPFQRAEMSLYRGGAGLGGAIGGIFGMQDPQLRMISQRQQLSQGLDMSDPNSIMQVAQQAAELGDMQFATTLAEYGRNAAAELAKTRASIATAKKAELTIEQENKLRDELAALGPNPTQSDIIATVSKYGSPERVLATLSTAATTRESIEARKDIEKERLLAREAEQKAKAEQREQELKLEHERKLEALREKFASQKEIEREKLDYKKQVAEEKKAQEEEKKANKTLTAGLQVKEDEDLKLIDSYQAQQKALASPIKMLTPDPKTKKPPLVLGPLQNRKYELANFRSKSTPESRAYAELGSAVKTAVNIQADAAKGVQTDRDIIRFSKALIDAYGNNDTQATLEALKRFNGAIKDAEVKTKQIIESRRKSQGVQPYFGQEQPATGTSTPKRVKFMDLPK
jgi:hypothetical protein